MNDDEQLTRGINGNEERGFFASLLIGLVRDAVKLVIAFIVGTGGGAIVCWYYSIPLVFSVIGGILVLGLALAFMTDGLFS